MASARSLRGSGGAGWPAPAVRARARAAPAVVGGRRRILGVRPRLRGRLCGRGGSAAGAPRPAAAAGSTPGMPGMAPGGSPGVAAGGLLALRRDLHRRRCTGRMYSRAVWPRLRASLPSVPGTVITRLSPSITTSDPDTPRPLTRALMICCAWCKGLARRPRTVGSAGRERHPGATLQVDARASAWPACCRSGTPAGRCRSTESRTATGTGQGAPARRRCHGPLVSSRFGSAPGRAYVPRVSPW